MTYKVAASDWAYAANNMRRFFYLLIFLLAIGIIVAAFFFFRYKNLPPPPPTSEEEPPANLPLTSLKNTTSTAPSSTPSRSIAPPPTAPSSLKVVYPNPVRDFTLEPDGAVLAIELDGKITEIRGFASNTVSPTPIQNLQKIIFAPDGSKLLAIFGDTAGLQAGVFDVRSRTWNAFPLNINDAAWSPTDNRLAYLIEKRGETTVGILDMGVAKPKPQTVLQVRLIDLALAWPSANTLILRDTPSGLLPNNAWEVDLKSKLLAPFAEDQNGLVLAWGKGTASEGLAFIAGRNSKGGTLNLLSPQGQVQQNFSFLTLPEKCGFGSAQSTSSTSRFLVCAVPKDTTALELATLPDDYYKGAILTDDSFYEINLSTGGIQPIRVDTNTLIDGTSIRIYNSALFFINRQDQKLYSLQIPK